MTRDWRKFIAEHEPIEIRVGRETSALLADLRDLLSDEARGMIERAKREATAAGLARAELYERSTVRGGIRLTEEEAFRAWAWDDGSTACSRERATPGLGGAPDGVAGDHWIAGVDFVARDTASLAENLAQIINREWGQSANGIDGRVFGVVVNRPKPGGGLVA